MRSKGTICLTADRSTGSQANLDNFVRPWLRKHRQEDHRVRSVANADERQSLRILPGRLIDLDSWDDKGESVYVVPHTHFENDEIQFAALNYCWRQDETNKLTEQSGDQVKIRVSQLAPTIRDAISVTKRLGLRYLWVDALCIMQNSKKDMDVELRKMSDIYSNADFVISAVAAADSSESFIVDRNPLAVNPCLIGVQDNANTPWSKLSRFGVIFALPS